MERDKAKELREPKQESEEEERPEEQEKPEEGGGRGREWRAEGGKGCGKGPERGEGVGEQRKGKVVEGAEGGKGSVREEAEYRDTPGIIPW